MKRLFLFLSLLATTPASAEGPCPFKSPQEDGGVLIAWITDVRETTQFGVDIETETTKVEPFRPLILLKGSSLSETQGAGISKGQRFWRVLAPAEKPVELASVGSFLDHMNVDHCVYFGNVLGPEPRRWTLLSSKPLPGVFRKPTEKDVIAFRALNTECIDQGVYMPEETPPCSRPELLAVTDLDKNGHPEYWATQPYIWDTGLTVWENTGKLVPLIQVCVGCSD